MARGWLGPARWAHEGAISDVRACGRPGTMGDANLGFNSSGPSVVRSPDRRPRARGLDLPLELARSRSLAGGTDKSAAPRRVRRAASDAGLAELQPAFGPDRRRRSAPDAAAALASRAHERHLFPYGPVPRALGPSSTWTEALRRYRHPCLRTPLRTWRAGRTAQALRSAASKASVLCGSAESRRRSVSRRQRSRHNPRSAPAAASRSNSPAISAGGRGMSDIHRTTRERRAHTRPRP